MSDRDEPRPFNSTEIKTSGNLAANPRDISRKEDGSVAVFGLIANRRDGRGDEYTDRFDCKSISPSMSANILASLRKGMAVKVEGRLEISFWTNKEGEEVPQFTIILDSVDLPLKYRSLEDHSSKFESADDDDDGGSRRKRGRGRAAEDDDDDDDDDEEEEIPRRRRAANRRSSGSSGSSRRKSRNDDDEEESKTRRARRGTRTRGDSDDEDDEI